MKVKYSDRFFIGEVNPIYFATSISCEDYEDGNLKYLDINIGDVEGGLNYCVSLDDKIGRAEALLYVRKLTEGLKNLLTVLEKECE